MNDEQLTALFWKTVQFMGALALASVIVGLAAYGLVVLIS